MLARLDNILIRVKCLDNLNLIRKAQKKYRKYLWSGVTQPLKPPSCCSNLFLLSAAETFLLSLPGTDRGSVILKQCSASASLPIPDRKKNKTKDD